MNKKEYIEMVKKATKDDPVAQEYFLVSKPGKPRNKKVLELIEKQKKDVSILNVGDGTGTLSLTLEQKGYKNIVSCDMNKEYLEIAAKRCKHTAFVYGDAHKLPFKDNEFQVLTYLDIVEFLELDQTLKEASRVVKNGGLVYFENFNAIVLRDLPKKWPLNKLIVTETTYKTYTYKELKRACEKHGFEIVQEAALYDGDLSKASLIKKSVYGILNSIPWIKRTFTPVMYVYLKKQTQ